MSKLQFWKNLKLTYILMGIGIIMGFIPLALPKSRPDWVSKASIIVAILTFVLSLIIDSLIRQHDKKSLAKSKLEQVIHPLRYPYPPGNITPLSLFNPLRCQSVFYGRTTEKKKLDEWHKSKTQKIIVISGGPLVGKTRLALEWASKLQETHITGWLRHEQGSKAISTLALCKKPAVLIVDTPIVDLAYVLENMQTQTGDPILKIIIVTRDANGLISTLRSEFPLASAAIDGSPVIHLGPIGTADENQHLFNSFRTYYATHRIPKAPTVQPALLPDFKSQPPIGILHVAALSSLEKHSRNDQLFALDHELESIWKTEVRSWRESRIQPQWALQDLSDSTIETAILALCVIPGNTSEQAYLMLKQIPGLTSLFDDQIKNIINWAKHAYPQQKDGSKSFLQIAPSLVTDAAFFRMAKENSKFAVSALQNSKGKNEIELISRFIRHSSILPHANIALRFLLRANTEGFSEAVKESVAAAPTNSMVDACLSDTIFILNENKIDIDFLLSTIPPGALPRTRASLLEIRLKRLQSVEPKNENKHNLQIADTLFQCVSALMITGEASDRALQLSTKLLNLCRRLPLEDEVQHRIALGSSLELQALVLKEFNGREVEAFQFIQQSVQVLRALNADYPEACEAELGHSLRTYTNVLDLEIVIRDDYYEFLQESVSIYRKLAKKAPSLYDIELAASLSALATLLDATGHLDEEALKASDEALSIARRCYARSEIGSDYNLAGMLLSQTKLLLGSDSSLKNSTILMEECINILLRLYHEDINRYEKILGQSHYNYAVTLEKVGGRNLDAWKAATEACKIGSLNQNKNTGQFDILLFRALRLRGGIAHKIDYRVDQALMDLDKAIEIYRALPDERAKWYELEFADVLLTFADLIVYKRLNGRYADALDATSSAVTILASSEKSRLLVTRSQIASGISIKSRILDALETSGEKRDALKFSLRAVAAWTEVFEIDPDTYEISYSQSLEGLMDVVARANGNEVDIVNSVETVISGFERLEAQYPHKYWRHVEHAMQEMERVQGPATDFTEA